MTAKRRVAYLLSTALPLATMFLAPSIGSLYTRASSPFDSMRRAPQAAQKPSAKLRVAGRTVKILGLSWVGPVALGEVIFRDPTRDRSLRVVTIAVSKQDRGAFLSPELGDTVEIEFLEGDPDRPLVLGLLSPKVDDVAPGEEDDGKAWVKIRLRFAAATLSKNSRSSDGMR